MKICLAGTGAMGAIHVKALAKMSEVEVVSINGRTEESGKAFAAEWNIPFQSANLEQCIDRPGVDAVRHTHGNAGNLSPDRVALERADARKAPSSRPLLFGGEPDR